MDLELANGNKYSGEIDQSCQPHGTGKMRYADGSTHEGYWANGIPYGAGTQTYADGSQIRGFWYEGELIHEFSSESAPIKLPKNKNKITALLIKSNYKKIYYEQNYWNRFWNKHYRRQVFDNRDRPGTIYKRQTRDRLTSLLVGLCHPKDRYITVLTQ